MDPQSDPSRVATDIMRDRALALLSPAERTALNPFDSDRYHRELREDGFIKARDAMRSMSKDRTEIKAIISMIHAAIPLVREQVRYHRRELKILRVHQKNYRKHSVVGPTTEEVVKQVRFELRAANREFRALKRALHEFEAILRYISAVQGGPPIDQQVEAPSM